MISHRSPYFVCNFDCVLQLIKPWFMLCVRIVFSTTIVTFEGYNDMMSEFWFAFIKFSRQDYWICIQRLAYFYSKKDLRTNLFPSKNINKYGRWFEDQRCSCLTISVIVFNMASRHLLNMENKGYSGALGSFLMGGNDNFTGYFDASNSVAVNSIESSWLHCCTFL